MTRQQEIDEWIATGRKSDAAYLLVVCDTFSYEDYPVYVPQGRSLDAVRKRYDGVNMQRILQVVDLSSSTNIF